MPRLGKQLAGCWRLLCISSGDMSELDGPIRVYKSHFIFLVRVDIAIYRLRKYTTLWHQILWETRLRSLSIIWLRHGGVPALKAEIAKAYNAAKIMNSQDHTI